MLYINYKSNFRLLINLTSPALMFYNEELPTDKVTRTLYQEIVSHLQAYKIALADENVWNTVKDHLGNLLSIVNIWLYCPQVIEWIVSLLN